MARAHAGHVRSPDGATIAHERAGSGPAVILVGGRLNDRSECAPLTAEVAAHHTVGLRQAFGQGLRRLPVAEDPAHHDDGRALAQAVVGDPRPVRRGHVARHVLLLPDCGDKALDENSSV